MFSLAECDDVDNDLDSDDDLSASMPVIPEDNELNTGQVQYRNSPHGGARRKPRPKSLDFQMMGQKDVDFFQDDFDLVKRQLLGDLQDEDEYYWFVNNKKFVT